MDCSTPGFSVLHYLPEFAQTHVHWVSDAIQPSLPLLPASFSSCLQSFLASGYFPLSQVAKVLELQLQSFQWIFWVDFLWDWLIWSPCCPKGLCLICLLSSHTQFSKILSTSSSSPPSHSSTPSIPPPGVETILAYITSDQHFTKCWVDIFQSSSY